MSEPDSSAKSIRSGLALSLTLVLLAGCADPNEGGFAETRSLPETVHFDCEASRAELNAIATTLVELETKARAEASALPTTVFATYKRLSDPRGSGLVAVADFERQRARYSSVASIANDRRCPTSDIDTKMEEAVLKMDAFRKGA